MSKRLTTEEFIKKAKEKHGDKYDYSKVDYKNNRSHVCIICPIHGEFWQRADKHLSGRGCAKCGNISISLKLRSNLKEFIEKSKEVHGDKYDYSKVDYINNREKVCIICPIHGEFQQRPGNHISGKGCPKCGTLKITEISLKRNYLKKSGNPGEQLTVVKKRKSDFNKKTEIFIEKAKRIHKDTYDYSKVRYTGGRKKVTITCPIHGDFEQCPEKHLKGFGCPVCSGRDGITTEKFIKRAKEIHGNKYDYSKVDYKDNKTKVTIICPKHGEFEQAPSNHLRSCGCRKCYFEGRSIYNKEKVFELGRKFTTRSEFSKKEGTAYRIALKNGWLEEMTHWELPKRPKIDMITTNNLIYCYEFPDNVVYIGRTCNLNNRDKNHRRIRKHSDGKTTVGAVLRYSMETGLPIPKPTILKNNLTLLQSQEEEDNYRKEFESKGYTLLNIAKTGLYCGALGSYTKYDNYEQILEVARNYDRRWHFQKNHGGMYRAVKKMGLWEKLVEEVGWVDNASQKPIYVYKKDKTFIGIFPSAREAEKATGVGFRKISKIACGKIKKPRSNFIFSFIKLF